MRRFTLGIVSLLVAGLAVPAVARAANPPPPSATAQAVDAVQARGPECDPIDPSRCLLPFPDDFFTVADPSTPTGRRVAIPALAMPINVAGAGGIPYAWNQADGFSPGSALLTLVPGLNLDETWGTTHLPANQRPDLADLARYREPASPFVVIDAATGERYPIWTELDSRYGVLPGDRVLIVHPAVNFLEGHHYIVALRNMRTASGSIIPPSAAFAAYRDGLPAPAGAPPSFDARRSSMDADFAALQRAGIDRHSLYLAWDFTVASAQSIAGTELHIRNAAFATLGDTNLGDGKIEGVSPTYSISSVTNFTTAQDPVIGRQIYGTITVPNYLTPQVSVTVVTPEGIPVVGGMHQPVPLPGSHLYYVGSKDGYPVQDPLQPTWSVGFVCDIPHSAWTTPSHPSLYGHGLLGNEDEVNGSSDEQLRLHNFTTCATDWVGFAEQDIPSTATTLADISNFPSSVERAEQGFINFMFLGRALAHPAGLVDSPAFRSASGRPLIQTNQLYYYGNSQGGIMGGALTALDPDFTRAVLGVTAMNYSIMLDRGIDWTSAYFYGFEASYPDRVDEEINYDLLQMLWDKAEADGYAQHMTTSPYPDTPPHQVLMDIAWGDHQVPNVASEVEGRTVGVELAMPSLAPGLQGSVDPTFGFQTVDRYPASGGSYLVYWDSTDEHDGTPPMINTPDYTGLDPHDDPRRDYAVGDQEAAFLLTGRLIDVCHGGPCVTTASTRVPDEIGPG